MLAPKRKKGATRLLTPKISIGVAPRMMKKKKIKLMLALKRIKGATR